MEGREEKHKVGKRNERKGRVIEGMKEEWKVGRRN